MEYKIGTDARCAVIGYGSWATAIVGLLAANGRRVGWYVRNPEVLESLCSDGRNPRYLNDLEFDRNSIAPSSDLDAVVRDADIVILATPSAYLKDFLAPLTVPLRDKFVVSAIKGIVPGDYKTIVEYIHDHYRLSYKQIGIFTGLRTPRRSRAASFRTSRSSAPIPKTRGASANALPGRTFASAIPRISMASNTPQFSRISTPFRSASPWGWATATIFWPC